MIAIVRLAAAGERNMRSVMEVVIPQCVESEPASLRRTQQPDVLRLILTNKNYLARPGRFARAACDRRNNMLGGGVENLLCRIEAETVKMKLLDPVLDVGQKKFPHGCSIGPIEIERLTPIALVSIR